MICSFQIKHKPKTMFLALRLSFVLIYLHIFENDLIRSVNFICKYSIWDKWHEIKYKYHFFLIKNVILSKIVLHDIYRYMCVYSVYMCMRMYVYICMYICVCLYIYIYVCVYVCVIIKSKGFIILSYNFNVITLMSVQLLGAKLQNLCSAKKS